MSNKLKSLFYSKLELVLILGLASLFVLIGLITPKSIAKGDVTQSDTSGTWFGNLGPAAVGSASSDVDTKSAQIGINYNSTLSQYEATQTANGSYFIRSKVIAPASGTLKKWKQLKLGLRRPANTNTAITVDILCGDPLQPPQCGTLYQPIVGYTNIPLSANDDYDIPQTLAAIKIMIRVNFSSVDVLQPQIALYNWQVSWLVNSGVNLTVSKTPNPANPEEQYPGSGPYPGVNNNNTVVYTLNYSLDTTVHGLTLELPVPVGVYTPSVGAPKTYTAAYIASSGGSLSGNKVVWSLGDKLSGTVGAVSATFKIQTGPPNGTVFKTNPLIWGTDYNLSKTSLPDDLLNIQSWGFAQSYVIAPQYIAPNTEVGYVVRLNAIYYYFQSDIFNSHYEFNYSNCLDNTDTSYPKVYGSGLASWSVDRPNRKIVLNMNSPVTAMLNMDYTITLKSSPSCGSATVGGTLTLVSDLDIDKSIKAQKVSNVTWDGLNPSNWDSTSTPRLSVGKNTWNDPTGAGARVDYSLRFDQQSTVPATNFYAIDQIPAQTTFVSANFYPGLRAITGGIVNNWKIYWSNSLAQPSQNDVSWTQLQGGPVPCSASCTVPSGQEGNVRWLKWEVGSANSFLWDRQDNFDPPLGSLSVVTNPSVTGTIVNTIQSYANNVCQLGCSTSRTISSDNKPYFETASGQSANTSCASYPGGVGSIVVQSGASYCAQSIIANSNGSHGDATDVYYTMRLPDRDYLDPSYNPMLLPSSEAHALCLLNGPYSLTCPDQNGVPQNDPPWLRPESANCSGATGPCTVTWHIRKIYSAFSYPAKVPFQYAFWIQVKTKPGLFDQQEICRGNCTLYSISTTPANANTNFPIANTNTVTISASVTTHITNVGSPTLDCSQTAPNGLATYTMTYDPTGSTGNIQNLYVMNALPEVGPPTVNPPVRLIYNSESHTNAPNMTVWYLLNYQRNGNPPSSNTSGSGPGWVSSITPAQWPTVDWVMWKKTAPLAYNALPESVTLTLTDQSSCSPNKTQYIDRGFVSYDSNSASPTVATATTVITNPGFITTSKGDIGSQSGINFPIKAGNWSKVDYLAISQGTVQNLQSLKNWLVTSYSGGLPNPFTPVPSSSYPNYDTMLADYSRDAKTCINDASCLAGDPDKVKLFQPSSSYPALVINSISSYSSVPRIIFVPEPISGSDALVMNTNFSITASSGIIFVVKGNVSVNYGVTSIAGVFLVDGKFSTGTRSSTNTTGTAAGGFATISTGQDGFARIVYLSGDNVRLIKCNDLDCQNRDYGYVTSVVGTSVTSINMALYPASVNVDYPQIVISQNDTKYTTKFINCSSQDCLSSNTITYQDAKDSDIIYNNAKISFVLGSGGSTPRSATIYQCPDQACLSPAASPIDGGIVSNQDKGNDLNISADSTGTLVVTYVDRSVGTPNKSDLWIARYNSVNTGTGCSPATITSWDCRRISPTSPGNVGVFPSSTTDLATNFTKNIYIDSSNRLNYLGCTNVTCTTTTTNTIDCGSGTCSAQVYGSIKTSANGSHALYNTINTGSSNKEVKLAYCTTTCLSWPNIFNMTNNSTFSVRNADIYNQGLAYGLGTEAGMPRIVFYNEDDKSLYYIHCKVVVCDPANPANVVYKKIDDGVAIALKDTQLTISGSVIAFGNGINPALNLQRDLFNSNATTPGEVVNFDPKYFYIFKAALKTPKDIIREAPP